MSPNEIAEFTQLVSDVHAYYRQPVSDFVLKVWLQACQPFTLEQVRKAMTAHVTDAERGVYAPKVADVVRVLSGTTTDRAALAWGKVLGAMSAVGAYTDVIFDDPAIHAAIEDLGGWVKICRGEIAELSYLQHRFCASHKAYTGRGQFDFQRKLLGDRSPDADYEKRGLPLPKPAIVGDREQALKVYELGSAAAKTAIAFDATVHLQHLMTKRIGA